VERAEDAVLGMGACNSSTQIVPTIVGESHEALAPSEHLARNGMLAAAVRPPTVPVGSSRLWLAVQSSHEPEDIDRLIAVLGGQR
jgi:8-amino-7-oxononanoate synthase